MIYGLACARESPEVFALCVASAVANEALVHGKLLYLLSLVPIGQLIRTLPTAARPDHYEVSARRRIATPERASKL